MALSQQEINKLEYTAQGYRLKGANGAADTYYDKSVLGYNPQGQAMPTIIPNIQQQSQPINTSVTTGQINPNPINYAPQSGPIPTSQITNQNPINLGTPPPAMDQATPAVAGAAQYATQAATQAAADKASADAAQAKSPYQTQSAELTKRLLASEEALRGRAAYKINQENLAGADQLTTAKAQLDGQILSKNAEYQQLLIQNQNRQGITSQSYRSREQRILNEKSAEIGLLQAQSLAFSGQLAAAQEVAKRATDLKYAADLENIDIYSAQLKALEPFLTREEAKQATALAAENEAKKYQITQKAADENKFHAILQTGMNNSMPLNIGQQAQALYNSGNELAALALMSKYTGTKTQDAGFTSALQGLTSSQINTTVNQIAGSFDNEQLVKDFNQINAGYKLVQGLSNTSKNPSDDQALIYAFAKVMDPGSVVREGEYNTVQKYSQSLINSYGKGVTQAIEGTGFLSATAREGIKKTIESKYNTSLGLYQDLKKQYEKRIETAKSGGMNTITDYNTQPVQPPPNVITAPDGQLIEIIQ